MKNPILIVASIGAFSIAAIANDKPVEPDNTGINDRDRSGNTKTSEDQSNRPEDLKVTQNIRKALLDDNSLSTAAKNVKVITADGQVTLRGPVDSAAEKVKVEKLAKEKAGTLKVVNKIDVKH